MGIIKSTKGKISPSLLLILGLLFSQQLPAQKNSGWGLPGVNNHISTYTSGIKALHKPDRLNYNTTLIGRCAIGPAYTVCVSGDLAFFGNGGYLEIFDITIPTNPVKLSEILTPAIVKGLTVSGNNVFVANGAGGLRIIDVSDPAVPVEIGFFDVLTQARAVSVSV